MSIIKQDYGSLGNDVQTQMLIAPVLSNMVATQPFAIGEQFIVDNVLYKATKAIAIGDAISVGTGTTNNCVLSDSITQQMNTKEQLVTRVVENFVATDGYITFPNNRCVISAVVTISSLYCPLLIIPVNSSNDRAYVYVDRSTTGFPTKALSSGTTYTVVYKYIPMAF